MQNYTIIVLHGQSVVASITDRHITSDLAIRTLKRALICQWHPVQPPQPPLQPPPEICPWLQFGVLSVASTPCRNCATARSASPLTPGTTRITTSLSASIAPSPTPPQISTLTSPFAKKDAFLYQLRYKQNCQKKITHATPSLPLPVRPTDWFLMSAVSIGQEKRIRNAQGSGMQKWSVKCIFLF